MLEPTLSTAKTAAEILEAVSRFAWYEAHQNKDCPPDFTPTAATLAAWLPEVPEAAHLEAGERLAALYGLSDGGGCRWRLGRIVMGRTWRYNARTGEPQEVPNATGIPRGEQSLTLTAWERPGKSGPGWGSMGTFQEVHKVWLDQPAEHRPKHPLAPLVKAWQERPVQTTPYSVKQKASLARLHKIGDESRRLLNTSYDPDPPAQPFLFPEMTATVRGCPSWLLWLFDKAGGQSMSQGRGAPWPMRLFVGALLHLAVVERDGQWRTLPFPTEDVIRWIHPNGWANRRRDWERFPKALDDMARQLSYVPVPGIGSVALLFPSIIPRSPSDPLVEFTIRIPSRAATGARIDWEKLCQYGTDSAGHYRAYLAACAIMDNSAIQGQPVTRQIDEGILRSGKGKGKRRTGKMTSNPASRYVQGFTDADLATMIGFDGTNKRRRHDARKAFERLADDGVLELDRQGGKVRLFGRSPAKKE